MSSRFLKKTCIVAGITVPLIVILGFGLRAKPNAIASPLVGHRAPSFHLRTLAGRPFLSSQSFPGHTVVLNFWASWCIPCKIEHPYLVDARKRFRRQGVLVVGVVYEDTRANAEGFLRQRGSGWPNVMDPGGRTAIDYGVYGVPETFFIDRNGVVRDKRIGPVTPQLLAHEIQRLRNAYL